VVNVTLAYSAIARNLSAAQLEAALAGLPLDTAISTLAGMTLTSDTTAAAGNLVTRTIVYQTAADPPLIPDANIGETAIGWYTIEFSKALATPITAAAPVVS
jgi:hypothetical protein